MEMFIDIFKQLGADESLVHQLVIIVVMFYLTKFLFLDHLQQVLENREEKTVSLEGTAEKQFEEINKIQSEYKKKMIKVTRELKQNSESAKTEIAKKEEAKYKSHEQEINAFVDKSRKEVAADLAVKNEKVMEEAQDLAGSLVQKIAKGL
ncbi:MAG: hypothetical protein HON90_09870 [Halobacteriovoraceae bacterium]|nr:hypothetical protein [Halobacteriovoraceae bacterium]